MKCAKYPDRDAVGVCSYSGRPYCAEELVDIDGKLIAKDNVTKLMSDFKDQVKSNQGQGTPMVFMNAGGGGGSSSAASATASAPASVPVYAPIVALKSKVTAGILALCFGGFGLHKFYLGKPIQGILYLLFFWTLVPMIVAWVEGVYYLVMNDHDWAVRYGGAGALALRVA